MFHLNVRLCTAFMPGNSEGQKRALGPMDVVLKL